MPAWVRSAYVETFASLLTSHFAFYKIDLQRAEVIAYWAEREPAIRQSICVSFTQLRYASEMESNNHADRDAYRLVAETLARVADMVAEECEQNRKPD